MHTAAGAGREPAAAAHDRVRQHLIDPGDPLFAALGADAAKRRQVDAFLRQLALVVRPAVARAAADGRPLHVVDLGCGNAYLTFAAHRYLSGLPELAAHGVRTVGVDVRPAMAERNADLAAELELSGLIVRGRRDRGRRPGPRRRSTSSSRCTPATRPPTTRSPAPCAGRRPPSLRHHAATITCKHQLDAARGSGQAHHIRTAP